MVINEIMSAPLQGTDDEFVELFNCSWDESVDLSGWTIGEIGLTIPAGTVILPRDYVAFAKKDTRFRQTHGSGLFMAGEYTGNLPDAGATLTLANGTGSQVDSFTYSASAAGSSLERIDPDKSDAQASNWSASSQAGGTPCASNSVSHVASFRSFVPVFTGSPWPMAALAIANAGVGPASVEFTARTADGTTPGSAAVNPAKRLLPANGQMAGLATELLPGITSPGWVEIQGENKRLGSLQILGGANQLDGGPTITTRSQTIYLAPVFSGSAVFRGKDAATFVNLANPNSHPVTVHLKLRKETGQAASFLQIDKTLAPLGMLSGAVSDLFGTNESLSSAYIVVQVAEGDGIVASHWVEIAGGSSLFCVPPQYPATSTRLFSAQFASLPDFFTEVILLNQAQTARSVTLKAWSENGSQLGQTDPIAVGAGAMVRLDGRTALKFASNSVVVGSLEVQADGPGVSGCVIFGDLPQLTVAAALPLQSDPFFREAVFSHLANGAGYYTGLAFYNPGNAPVTIRLRVFDHQAVKTGETELTLPAKSRKSALLHELAPSTAGQVRGFVLLSASGPLIAQQVFADTTTPRMSAVPPTALR